MQNIGVVRRRYGKAFIAVLCVLLLSALIYRIITRVFSLETIEVVGSDVQVLLDNKKVPKNLLFFPSDTIRSLILKDNPLLSDVQFVKKYPHTLIIKPVIRIPYVILQTDTRSVLLDRTGIVLTDGTQGMSLPVLHFTPDTIHVGENIRDSRVLTAIACIENMRSYLTVSSVEESDGASIHIKSDKTSIFITQLKPIRETLATLQTLIAGFRIKGTLPMVVDLRFDKPIIKF
jgi:cell division septal protein FtsQ